MIGKLTFTATASITALALASPAAAKDCTELASMALEGGSVTSAELIAPGAFEPPPSPFGAPPGVAASPYAGLPEFCRLQVTLTPTDDSDIKVEVWLPAKGWNGKFVGIGNGIWAGQVSYSQMVEPLSRGYATASTDTGHTGSGMTAEWAPGHPEKIIDFGYRAVHLMTLTAKQAIQDFYGDGPSLSFWDSCSTGGRQGVMSAYRYPEDYDAISAMAPANPMTDLMTQSMWVNYQSNRTPESKLTAAVLGLVHKAVLATCDGDDGLADGLVSRPNACNFDPGVLECKPGQDSATCLHPDQVFALRNIYGGVRDPETGEQLLPGWPLGSEIQHAMLVGGPQPFPVAFDYFRLLTFGGQPDWDWRGMNYASGLASAREYGAGMLDVPYDGLGPFFARGGKLLLSHGWSDGLIPANNSVRFYRGLYASLPSGHAQNDLRLFMVPGMDHCAGGDGPSSYDTLAIIDKWATTGMAPNRIHAERTSGGFPGAPVLPPMSRPLCSYPMVAKYDGDGDTNLAENFTCVAPES